MKKFFKSSIAITVAIATLVSCSKEVQSPIEEKAENLIEVTLIAGNPDAQSATKTEMSGTTPYWSVGDAIGVTNGSSTDQYEFTTSIVSASTTASFSGKTVSGDLYAYYPYTTNGVTAEGKAKVDIPANQSPTVNSFDGAADIMVAKQFTVSPENTTVEDLEFARLGAIVKIVLIDKKSTMTSTQYPTSVSMTAESDLVGRVYVDMPNQELGDIYYNNSTTVTANYTSETKYAINGSNATYLIVYPQTLAAGSSLTISASTADYSIEKVITVPAGGIELLPGKVNTLNINLLASHITLDSGAALPFNDNMSWADNGASDSSTDIGSSIASAENSNGLYTTGTKAYKGIGGLKLGTGSANGSITTQELDLSGAFYILIESGQYSSDTGTLEVTVDETKVITGGSMAGTNYINIAAGTYTKKSKVIIATSAKRGYIYSVDIVSGTYVPAPKIKVTTDNPMDVANTASSQTIEYTIDNPTAATLTAALQDPSDTWISNIDYSSDGEVTFDVAAQETDAAARSAVIVLSYTGADDVEVTVNQAAGPSSGGGGTPTLQYTLTPASGTNNSYTGNCDIVIDDITWNLTGNSQMQPWRIGGKSLSSVDRELYSKTAISANISQIIVEHGTASGITVNSMTVTVSKNSDFSDPVSTLTPSFVASDTVTIDRPDGKDWSNCYYKFTYKVTVTGTSNKFLQFTGAEFYGTAN